MAVLGLSLTDETETTTELPIGAPVFTWENLHTFGVLSHAVVVVVMTKAVAEAPTNAATSPVMPVPHDMIGTPAEFATKKPGGKLMVIALAATGAPFGSVKVTVTA